MCRMDIRIESNLSDIGLKNLLKGIFKYRLRLKAKIEEFRRELAEAGMAEARKAFGDSVQMTYEQLDDRHYCIRANGEEVYFLEFGTGVYTDSSHPLASEMPFKVYPGSWSENHQKTWQQWIAAGNDPYKYPYNHMPKYGMLNASTYMREHAREIAERVFST